MAALFPKSKPFHSLHIDKGDGMKGDYLSNEDLFAYQRPWGLEVKQGESETVRLIPHSKWEPVYGTNYEDLCISICKGLECTCP